MLVIDSSKPIQTTQSNYELTNDDNEKIGLILKQKNVSIDSFYSAESSTIIKCGKCIIVCSIRDLAGLRIVILGSSVDPFNWLNSKIMEKLVIVGNKLECDFVQGLLPVENISLQSIPDKCFATNFIFEANPNEVDVKSTNQDFIECNFNDSTFLKNTADLEFYTRWLMPGSSFNLKDNINSLRNEYFEIKQMIDLDIIKGICHINHPHDAFLIWFENKKLNSALVSFIWISNTLRGNDLGAKLLKDMLFRLKSLGLKSVNYFVAVENFSAQAMVYKSGFKITNLVVNRKIRP